MNANHIPQLIDPATIEWRTITNETDWLAWHDADVTASGVGALFPDCHHPYETALRLYAKHRGVEFAPVENSATERGKIMQPAVAEAVRRKHPEWIIKPADVYLRHKGLKLGATPDFFIHGDPRGLAVLEAKSGTPSVGRRDYADGRVPLWIVLQTLTQAMLADAAFGVVAFLPVDPFNMEPIIQEIPRNAAAEKRIIDAVEQHWIDVEDGNEPDPDFARDAAVIQAMYPRSRGGAVVDLSGNNELPALLAEREELHARIKAAEIRCSVIETELKFLMGDSEIATIPDWHITYKTGERKGYTVPAKTLRTLRIYDRRPDEARPIESLEES